MRVNENEYCAYSQELTGECLFVIFARSLLKMKLRCFTDYMFSWKLIRYQTTAVTREREWKVHSIIEVVNRSRNLTVIIFN
jgi:hypothetical protein